MLVEADVFSGRENPRWVLSVEDAAQLRGLLAQLEVDNTPIPDAPDLGYRGFRCTEGNVTVAVVYRDRAVVGDGGRTDPQRRVERWLVQTMPDSLHEVKAFLTAAMRE